MSLYRGCSSDSLSSWITKDSAPSNSLKPLLCLSFLQLPYHHHRLKIFFFFCNLTIQHPPRSCTHCYNKPPFNVRGTAQCLPLVPDIPGHQTAAIPRFSL